MEIDLDDIAEVHNMSRCNNPGSKNTLNVELFFMVLTLLQTYQCYSSYFHVQNVLGFPSTRLGLSSVRPNNSPIKKNPVFPARLETQVSRIK